MMALHPVCNIEIDGKYLLKSVKSVKISTSNKVFADKCEIELPARTIMNFSTSKKIIRFEDILKTGQKIVVKLGYNDTSKLVNEFEGYICELNPQNNNFRIKCEDEVYILRRTPVKAHEYSGTLKGWLSKFAPGVNLASSIPDVPVNKYTLTGQSTVAKEITRLAEYYLLTSYFRGQTLYVGLPYLDQTNLPVAEFGMTKNILAGGDKLEWTKKTDLNICVRAVSIIKNHKKLIVTDGDESGDMITILRRGIESEAELKKIAKAEREKFSYDGFRGSFTVLGYHAVQHSQIAQISDTRYAERNGKYMIESITKEFGSRGYRKEIHLGRQNN